MTITGNKDGVAKDENRDPPPLPPASIGLRIIGQNFQFLNNLKKISQELVILPLLLKVHLSGFGVHVSSSSTYCRLSQVV